MTKEERAQIEAELDASNEIRVRWLTEVLPNMPKQERVTYIRNFLTEPIAFPIVGGGIEIIFRTPELLLLTWDDLPPTEVKLIESLRVHNERKRYRAIGIGLH